MEQTVSGMTTIQHCGENQRVSSDSWSCVLTSDWWLPIGYAYNQKPTMWPHFPMFTCVWIRTCMAMTIAITNCHLIVNLPPHNTYCFENVSLPYGLDLNNQINVDKSSIKMVLTVDNLGSVELVELERIYSWFAANAPQYEVVASEAHHWWRFHISETNMASMLSTLPITLVLISGLLIFALRSVRLRCDQPSAKRLAPAIIGFGLWALISGAKSTWVCRS